MKRITDHALVLFDQWFASKAGVYQTVAFTLAIVLFEHLFPRVDPSGWALLYWLTVYSAITQPALAHTGRESAERLEAMQRDIKALLEREQAELTQIEADLHPAN